MDNPVLNDLKAKRFLNDLNKFLFLIYLFMILDPLMYFSHYLKGFQNPYSYKLPTLIIFGFVLAAIHFSVNKFDNKLITIQPIDKFLLSSLIVVTLFESQALLEGNTPDYHISYVIFYILILTNFTIYIYNFFDIDSVNFTRSIIIIGTIFSTICLSLYVFFPEAQFLAFKIFDEPPLGHVNQISYICAFISSLIYFLDKRFISLKLKVLLLLPNIALIIANQSRGAILALIVPLVLVTFTKLNKASKMAIGIILVSFLAYFNKHIIHKVKSSALLSQYSETTTGDAISASRRLVLIKSSVNSFVKSFPNGTTLSKVEEVRFRLHGSFEKNIVHTFYLILLSCYGIGGIFICLLFLLTYIKYCFTQKANSITQACFASLIVFLTFEPFLTMWLTIFFVFIKIYSPKEKSQFRLRPINTHQIDNNPKNYA
ncbi:MAG: hypothetical protein GY909_14855 [Oligoflexia bacterium]|nr:hypothetical protein [Oligoflexia bacterium]